MPRDSDDTSLPPHLDPRRARPGAAARPRSTGRPGRFPTWLVGGVRIVAALLSLVLIVGAGMASSLVTRLNTASGTGQSVGGIDGNVDGAGANGADQNILIVGNDSRAGYTDQQLQDELSTTGEDGMNTDTMMLVHVPADGAKASLVSFPRDSYVTIPGYDKGKLNSAYADGYVYGAPQGATDQQKQDAGQSQLISTISSLTGLHIDHYVEVTLLGFYKLTQALGGVEVTLCAAAQDNFSGVDLPAGKQTLDGKQALSFVRQRHNLPNGDLDRIKRQQYFIGAVIRKLLDQNLLDLLNYGKLQSLVDSLSGVITWDKDLNVFSLAEQMRNIAAGNVEFRTLPLANPADQKIGGQDVVVPAPEAELKKFFLDLNAATSAAPASSAAPTAAATVAPSSVTVDVVNATGTKGLGTETSGKLTGLGFVAGTVESAAPTDATVISYPTGQLAQANALLAQVPGATVQEDSTLTGKIRLTIGTGFGGLADSTSTGGSAQSSSAPDQTAAGTNCVN